MNLESLQREMAAAIMLPLTPAEEMRSQSSDGRSVQAIAESIIAPNSRLSSFERLEIYNRQYWFRVLSSLAEDFPALRAVVGEQRFDAISVAYLTAHPSRSFSLRNLGSRLPQWLSENPAAAGRRHRLAVDVARIEWAFVESFDNPESVPLDLAAIAALTSESRLFLQPHLQLMALNYPADDLVLSLHERQKRQPTEAGQRPEAASAAAVKIPGLRRKPIWLASHRVDLSVYYRRLEREEFQMLAAIREGKPLGEALEAGFVASSIAAQRRPARVQKWFADWAELGWLCAPAQDAKE